MKRKNLTITWLTLLFCAFNTTDFYSQAPDGRILKKIQKHIFNASSTWVSDLDRAILKLDSANQLIENKRREFFLSKALKKELMRLEIELTLKKGYFVGAKGNTTERLKYYNKGIDLAINEKEIEQEAYAHYLVSKVYQENNQWHLAYFHNKKAIQKYREAPGVDTPEVFGVVFTDLALCVANIKPVNHDSVVLLFNQALNFESLTKESNQKAPTYWAISEYFYGKSQYDSALKYTNKALNVIDTSKTPVTYYQILFHQTKADILIKKGDFKQAEQHALISSKLSSELNYYESQLKNNKLLSVIKAREGNYKKAYSLLETVQTINDSLHRKETMQLDAKYQYIKQNKTIESLSKENQIKKQYLYILIGLIGLLIVLVLLLLVFAKNKRLKSKIRLMTLEQELLTNQMNPHFLFNILQSVKILVKNNDPNAHTFIGKYARLVRSVLENSKKQVISLEDEIEFLTNYMNMQQLIHPNSFEYQFKHSPSLELDHVFITPMLIQPLIENAINYSKPEIKGKVNITLSKKHNKLYIAVSDNGEGLSLKNAQTTHKSYGISIMRERLYKKYSIDTLVIENNKEPNRGVKASFNIPLS